MAAAGVPGKKYTGWWKDPVNSRLAFYYNGTRVGYFTGSAYTVEKATSITGGITAATGGITATTGDIQATAGHVLVPAGNVKLGTAAAFATTQPVAAITMGGTSKGGTAPVGAIATSAGLFASDTVARKIIADGTASNVET